MNTFLKVLGIASGVVGALITAGIFPPSLAVVPVVIGIVSQAFHPSVQAVKAFGDSAK